MTTTFNVTATSIWFNVKRSLYALQLAALLIAIPVLTYLQMTHTDNNIETAAGKTKTGNNIINETAVEQKVNTVSL